MQQVVKRRRWAGGSETYSPLNLPNGQHTEEVENGLSERIVDNSSRETFHEDVPCIRDASNKNSLIEKEAKQGIAQR